VHPGMESKIHPTRHAIGQKQIEPVLRDSDPGTPVNGYYTGSYTQGIDEAHPRVAKPMFIRFKPSRLRYKKCIKSQPIKPNPSPWPPLTNLVRKNEQIGKCIPVLPTVTIRHR